MQNQIEISQILTPLDWVVFSSLLLATIIAIIYGQKLKKKEMTEKESFLDLLVMGRQLTLPLFVATLVATWYGGIFGVTEIAFQTGIYNFITQGVFWYVAYLMFAFLLVDKIPRDVLTLPDLVGKLYGEKSSWVAGFFNFFNVLPIAYVISLGLFLKAVFGWETHVAMISGTVFVFFYSVWGGFRAVVFSDLIQFFIMCLGVGLVIVFSFGEFGGLSYLQANLPERYFSLSGDQPMWQMWVWGIIALSTLVDPNFYQRCFAAKSPKTAKKGILLATIVWTCFDLCTTFGAMYAKAAIPEADSATAYLTYALQVLPNGLRGFFLAGILATVLSTLDSYLFLAGTTLSFDLVPKKWRGKPWIHHLGVFHVSLLALGMSFLFDGNIKSVWKTLGSYSAACLLIPVVIGQFSKKRISDLQFCLTSLSGALVVTGWRIWERSGVLAEIDALYPGVLTTSGMLAIFYLLPHNSVKTKI